MAGAWVPCPTAGGSKGKCGYKKRRQANINSCPYCSKAGASLPGYSGSASSLVTQESSESSDALVTSEGHLDFSKLKGRDRVKAMQEEIQAGLEQVTSSEEDYKNYLEYARTGKRYSFNNNLLILQQKGKNNRNCHTYKQWAAMGYQVKKGAKSASILRPLMKKQEKLDKDGNVVLDDNGKPITHNKVVGYTSYNVFAEGDLDYSVKRPPADPIAEHYMRHKMNPDVEDSQALRQDLTAVAEQLGISCDYRNGTTDQKLNSDVGGYATRGENGEYSVVINTEFPPHAQTATLAHELGHVLCGHIDDVDRKKKRTLDDARQQEVEAESVSYNLCKQYGLDKGLASFAYIKGWASDDPKRVEKALSNVEKALSKYNGALEKHLTGTNEEERTEAARAKVLHNAQERKKKGRRR